jgi:glucose/arabinose dehydrogenase
MPSTCRRPRNPRRFAALGTIVLALAAVVPSAVAVAAGPRNDFDGNGRDDILWRNAATGAVEIRLMNGAATSGVVPLLSDPNWTVTHTGDFNHDGRADLIWRNSATGQTSMWLMNGATHTGAVLASDPNWRVVAIGDLDGDLQDDIVWRHASGQVVAWLMNGASIKSSAVLLNDASWVPAFVADIDGDGMADIVWRNAAAGTTVAWKMNGTSMTSSTTLLARSDWVVTHVADFDADGVADLVWRSASSGMTALWRMNASFAPIEIKLLMTTPVWTAAQVGDLDGDGRADIVWYNPAYGTTAWLMNGTTMLSWRPLLADPAWSPARLLDLDGGGRKDIVWQRADGARTAWIMNGTTLTSWGFLSTSASESMLVPPPEVAVPPGTAARTRVLNASLASPWGLAFLPDGRMLVTQKGGSMVLLSADGSQVQATLVGVPAVNAAGQGGLLDVVVDPGFDGTTNRWVYWTFSEDGTGGTGTAVARGELVGATLQNVDVIFRQQPKVGGSGHYGSRIAFRADGTMFVTLGERQLEDPANPGYLYAQNVATHLGKVVRINRNGSVPAGNPSFGASALPQLWSIGHRNPQGAAIHPSTGELWLNEHGPQGGDEINRVVAGGNYGWPIRSYGCPYGSTPGPACQVGGGTHAPAYLEPVSYWVPLSIAPAGLAFYTGDRFPEWQGSAFLGALAGQALWRVALVGNAEVARQSMFGSLGERIRCVRQGPDGFLYLLTDSGKLIRVER